MLLPVPIPTVETGPQYATDLNSCLTTIDSHDHSSGKGTFVTPAGLNINQDLSFVGNNSTNLRSVRFTAQASPISLSSDLGCLYVSGVDLYYNDENGNQIQMTKSGSIAGAVGTISGLVPPASLSYVSGTQTFVFQSTTATPANLDSGSIILRDITANSKGITLSAPAALGSNYTFTLPSSTPSGSSGYLAVNNTGNMFYASQTINITNWTIYPLTIHGATDPSTSNGNLINQALYRRVGDSMEVRYNFYQNGGSGNTGSGTYQFPIPSGFQIDGTKIPIALSGSFIQSGIVAGTCGYGQVEAGGLNSTGNMVAYSSTSLAMLWYNAGLNANGAQFVGASTVPFTSASAIISFQASIPIVGWSI